MTSLLLSFVLALLPQQTRTKTCDGEAELKNMVARSDVVLIAEVKEVEPTFELQPWSGGLIGSRQHVRYEIRSVLKGEMPGGGARVGFYLIKNSQTAGKDWPHLSPELFREHSLHVVFIEIDPLRPPTTEGTSPISSYVGADQDCGAIIATPDAEAAIRRLLLRTKGGAAGTINGTEGHKVTFGDKTASGGSPPTPRIIILVRTRGGGIRRSHYPPVGRGPLLRA